MPRKNKKHVPVPAECATHTDRRSPRPSWLPGRSEALVIIVVIAIATALVDSGMSVGAAVELVGGGWLVVTRLRRERA
ncbi:hypothetical protein ACFV1L_13080 [Kitasatospora sp. NPDC059646]|uniref:hypothetical protein n=1 Tax=Kitasatospora sp. NPDC059646 TaxID=3346893 RepID=UPI0036B53168